MTEIPRDGLFVMLAAGDSVTVTGMRRASGDGVVGVTRILVARDGRLSRACGCPRW